MVFISNLVWSYVEPDGPHMGRSVWTVG